MKTLTTEEIARACGGTTTSSVEVTSVVIDNREVTPGALFVAICGERLDGHQFVQSAIAAGAAAVMPLAAPIGSNKGLATKAMIQVLIDEIDLPVIVDAGIGKPSQACEAMEMGAAAIMANTAIATAGDVPAMARAFKLAIEAGRLAYLTGMGRVLARGGSASDPLTGFLR